MTFKVVNKYLQENNRTFVAIRQDAPYTAFDRVLIGDRVSESDEVLIQAVIGQVATELNPADGVKKLQEDLQTQAQDYEVKLAEKDAKIAEVKAVADWAVLARVTDTDNPLDPTVFKRGLELVELGKTGKTYKSQEIFALENPNHVEKFQEGKRFKSMSLSLIKAKHSNNLQRLNKTASWEFGNGQNQNQRNHLAS